MHAASEISKFDRLCREWWDPRGKLKILHTINPLRISFIRKKTSEFFGLDGSKINLFQGIDILDIGCGGGILCEPLCRLGGNLTGIDLSKKSLEAAKVHAEKMNLGINYIESDIKNFDQSKKFKIVTALEIIEHINDWQSFLQNISEIIEPGGLLFLSTINRNIESFVKAKFMAEFILKWVPIGTHSWKKFLKPSEIRFALESLGFKMKGVKGFEYKPFSNHWILSDNIGVNYMLCAQKL